MIRRLNDENKGIAIITDPTADNEDIQYCNECSEYRKKNVRLVPLIHLDSDPLPPDYEDFKSCPVCYAKIPIYEVRTEGILFSDLEPIKSPFDFGNVEMKGLHERGLSNRIKQIAKKNKSKSDYSKDPEIQQEIKDGAVITAYYTSTN